MRRLPPGTQRALAVFLLVLPFLLVLAGGLWAYAAIERQRVELAAVEAEIAMRKARIATREDLLAELRLLERTSELETLLVQADTAPLAQADLQGQLTSTIEGAGGTLGSIQALPPEAVEGFVRLPLRVQFEADMNALREILHAIETMEPVFIVERLQANPDLGMGEGLGNAGGLKVSVVAEVAGFGKGFGIDADGKTDLDANAGTSTAPGRL